MALLNKDNETNIQALALDLARAENEEAFAKAQVALAAQIEQDIIVQAKQAATDDLSDSRVLESRGLRALTSHEKKYYAQVLSTGGFRGIEELMPITIIDRIFKDIEAEHPLLQKIQFVNTTGITKWLAKKSDAEGAVWGKLGTEIKKKLDNSFTVVNTTLNKLTAFIPVSKDILVLGDLWIDKFVRVLLAESIAIGLEKAIIEGNGVDCPVGMLKDITQAKSATTGYPDKAAVALNDLKPATLGKNVMKPLVDKKVKTVNNVLLICNPGDYWEKIFPQTTVLSAAGQYVFNVLPINAEVCQSAFVPEGKLIACIPDDYFLGIGFNGPVVYSDEYQFLEDERVYAQKLLGHGQPIEPKSFLVFNIAAMAIPSV
ncbi:phage major capsid protein [Peptostreptococcus sp.]